MTKLKPIIDKGIILYYDYEYIFNFLSDEELGVLIRQLLTDRDNPSLNPTDNNNINNAYNYIANRITDYKLKNKKAVDDGKKGGNPLLTLNPTLNPTLNQKENKIKEDNIKENKFIIPCVQEVHDYMNEYSIYKSLIVDMVNEPERFIDFYASKGWLVGKAKMKDWKASVRNWLNKPIKQGNYYPKKKTMEDIFNELK